MFKIDKVDCRIIDLLMQDGRLTASEIARSVGGISERAVRYRMERMIAAELIQVRAIVNPKALGYSVVADVFIEVESGLVDEVARRLSGFSFVSYVATSIGERDISIQLIASNNSEVYRYVTEVIGKIPGVRKTTTSIVPQTLKDIYQWSIPEGDCQGNP